jgi:Leucine-rich repeat (LRR) protein
MKKGLESTAELSKLERLTFRGVKMNNLDLINQLKNLKQLRLLFGSYKNLESIANVKSIKTLEISRTRQIPNYDFLKSMDNLNSLYFEGMSKMESLPDLSGLTNLKRIQIDNNSRLTDITNLNQLPSLETFLLFFPENFKASYRKDLFKQATEFLLESKTVKYTNLFLWLEDDMKEKLQEKGIKKWDYGMNI